MPRDPGSQLVEREFLTLSVWDQLDAQTAETVARAVEACLPEPWAFNRVAWYECGDQKRHVAFFERNKIEFALVPGGEVTLGYDPERPAPPVKLLDEWDEETRVIAASRPKWNGVTWDRYLPTITSPLRQMYIGPFLIAVRGEPKRQPTAGAERNAIAGEGLKLPAADQWEFACSANSRAAWHWGDNPIGGPPEVNAFGLEIVRNTYIKEALDEPGHYRGGDGGIREHGGCGNLERFVPLSSWFRCRSDPEQENRWKNTRYRRVFPLPDAMLG